MAEVPASAFEDNLLLDSLSAEQRLMLLCCCCGQTVSDPVLLRCLHACCSPCADNLDKGLPEEAPETQSIGITPPTPVACEVTSLCRTCGEPLLLAAGRIKRRNYFLAAILHSLLVEERYAGRKRVPPPPPPCDVCPKYDSGSATAASLHKCTECRLNMCDRCAQFHNVFTEHRASMNALPSHHRELLPPPAPACAAHGDKPCRAVCLTCSRAACDDCAQTCRGREHDVRRGGDRAVADEAELRRKDVRSNRAILCDQLSILADRRTAANHRRAAIARKAREALAARRLDLHAAVDRAHDDLVKCFCDCSCQGSRPLSQASVVGRSYAAEPHECPDATKAPEAMAAAASKLDQSARHLLAYSEAFQSFADDLVLLEQHHIVTARLTMLKKYLEAAARAADDSGGLDKGSDEERRLRELSRMPADDGALLEDVARLCLLGHAQQLTETLVRPSAGNTNTDGRRSGDGIGLSASHGCFGAAQCGRNSGSSDLSCGIAFGERAPACRDSSSVRTAGCEIPGRSTSAVRTTSSAAPAATTRSPRSPRPMQLGYPRSRFRTRAPCFDLTFCAEGYVLLAAGEEGLLEFMADGPLVGGWTPPKQGDSVTGVVTLGDGRVVVTIRNSPSLWVLRRKRRSVGADGGRNSWDTRHHADPGHGRSRVRTAGWTLDRQLPVQIAVRAVAASGALAAVVGGPSGRQLLLVSLIEQKDDGWAPPLTTRDLDCDGHAVALTRRSLVLLCELSPQGAAGSSGSVAWAGGGNNDRPCAVQCYAHGSVEGDHSGGLQWKTVCDHWSSDVCASPCDQILYLAQPYVSSLLALAVSDGSSLTVIRAASDGWTLRGPSWLAVWPGLRQGDAAAEGSGVASTLASHHNSTADVAAASTAAAGAAAAGATAAMLSVDQQSVSVFPAIF